MRLKARLVKVSGQSVLVLHPEGEFLVQTCYGANVGNSLDGNLRGLLSDLLLARLNAHEDAHLNDDAHDEERYEDDHRQTQFPIVVHTHDNARAKDGNHLCNYRETRACGLKQNKNVIFLSKEQIKKNIRH